MRCSVARRATATSSMVSVRTPGIGPPTPTSGLPRSCRRATSCSVSSSETAITASTRWRSRKCSNTLDALAAVAREVVEGEVVAAAEERLLRALEHRREEPAVEERDHHADVARAPRREARGVRRDDVPEARGGLDDLRLRRGGDVAAAAERARDRRGGDPRELRDLFDAGHVLLVPGGRGSPVSARRSPASTESGGILSPDHGIRGRDGRVPPMRGSRLRDRLRGALPRAPHVR